MSIVSSLQFIHDFKSVFVTHIFPLLYLLESTPTRDAFSVVYFTLSDVWGNYPHLELPQDIHTIHPSEYCKLSLPQSRHLASSTFSPSLMYALRNFFSWKRKL